MNNWIDRVKERMALLGISREVLAQEMGVTYGAVTHYLTGRSVPPLGQFQKLAEILKTDPAWLHYGKQVISDFLDKKVDKNEKMEFIKHPVPVLSWREAAEFINNKKTEFQEFVPQFYSEQSQWFALRVQGDAMTAHQGNMKTFLEGSIIVVDPHKKPAHGNFIIALLPDAKEVTFKQYVVDNGIQYLKPLNPQYPMVKIDDSTKLCGVVVWCLNSYI